MRSYIQILSYVLLSGLLCCSCNKEKLKAPVVSYIKIDTALVAVTTTTSQGTASNKITDIWVYVDQQFKGAYPLGNLIPVVGSGHTEVQLYPGIKNNGISATRQPYTFLSGLNLNLNLVPNQTTRLKPAFTYKPGAHFFQVDGFEGGSSLGNMPDALCTSTVLAGPEAFEGSGYLSMSKYMTDAQPLAKVWTNVAYPLPPSGANVYLELNYNTNQPMEIGVYDASYGERPAIMLNATNGWNKIYIQLTTVVSTLPAAPTNRIYIKSSKQVASPMVYIDNLKLISE